MKNIMKNIKQILIANKKIHIENKIFKIEIEYNFMFIIVMILIITGCYLSWLLGIKIYN